MAKEKDELLSSLFSTVINKSGVTKVFGFLPPHGASLAPNGQYTVLGHIADAVVRGHRVTSRRHHQALVSALDRGDLDILQVPAPVLTDKTTLLNKVIKLDNGTLSGVDPSWKTSDTAHTEVAPK